MAKDPASPPILGIDLGTTKSMACVVVDGHVKVIKPDPRRTSLESMPSVYCMTPEGPRVGYDAINVSNLYELVANSKREMRRGNRPLYPRQSKNPNLSPVDVAREILAHLRHRAAQQLNVSEDLLSEVVVTVPAYFGQAERGFTRDAAQQAGFDTVRLLDEPLAAAIGLRLHEREEEELALVVDLGGGTFDVSLLRFGKNVNDCGFEEIFRGGYDPLGGIDWDKAIADFTICALDVTVPPDFLDTYASSSLLESCEAAKKSFCEEPPARDAAINFSYGRARRPYNMKPEEFVAATQELAERCARICRRLLEDVPEEELQGIRLRRKGARPLFESWWPFRRQRKLTWQDINSIYMVGGGSRVPAVREAIGRLWGKVPELRAKPEHRVAFGAAICAATLRDRTSLFDRAPVRVPHAIGCWVAPNGNGQRVFRTIVRRNQRVKVIDRQVYVGRLRGVRTDYRLDLIEERIHPANDEPDYQQCVGTIHLTNLPPPPPGDLVEELKLTLECHTDQPMTVRVRFRGVEEYVELEKIKSSASDGER
jgi:molecular chaperone DnaK (HSP70)